MAGPSREQVLRDLAGLLKNYQGREYSDVIDGRTRFFGDLGLTSIHAVHFAELLERHYGRTFPFQEFLAGLAQRQAEDLELGELAEFLHRQMHTPGGQSCPS